MGLWRNQNQDIINKFGENKDVDIGSVPETIWTHGGVFPFIDTGIPMDIVSSDVDDNIAGSGAQKAIITYYETDNTEVMIEIDLNGTTRVQIADDIKINTRIEIIQTGASNTNEGKINIVDRATGAIVYQSIEIGEGQTLSAVQICAKDKRGLVKQHLARFLSLPASSEAALRLRLRKTDGSILTKYNVTLNNAEPVDLYEYNIGGIKVLSGEIIFWECISTALNNTSVECRFDMEFIGI